MVGRVCTSASQHFAVLLIVMEQNGAEYGGNDGAESINKSSLFNQCKAAD